MQIAFDDRSFQKTREEKHMGALAVGCVSRTNHSAGTEPVRNYRHSASEIRPAGRLPKGFQFAEVGTDKQLLRVAKKMFISPEFEAIRQVDRRVKK
jgi:hypothetical protein